MLRQEFKHESIQCYSGSSNALRVNQLGLQVVGNNIANVNTPGYIRQELIQAPARGYKAGDLVIGQGVQAVGIQQKLDAFVIDRLRQTQSQLSYQEQLEGTNAQVENLLNELTDKDFSSNLSRFANAFQDVANQPAATRSDRLRFQEDKNWQRNYKISQQASMISRNVTNPKFMPLPPISIGLSITSPN